MRMVIMYLGNAVKRIRKRLLATQVEGKVKIQYLNRGPARASMREGAEIPQNLVLIPVLQKAKRHILRPKAE